jgi:chromosome segregation ATPase
MMAMANALKDGAPATRALPDRSMIENLNRALATSNSEKDAALGGVAELQKRLTTYEATFELYTERFTSKKKLAEEQAASIRQFEMRYDALRAGLEAFANAENNDGRALENLVEYLAEVTDQYDNESILSCKLRSRIAEVKHDQNLLRNTNTRLVLDLHTARDTQSTLLYEKRDLAGSLEKSKAERRRLVSRNKKLEDDLIDSRDHVDRLTESFELALNTVKNELAEERVRCLVNRNQYEQERLKIEGLMKRLEDMMGFLKN